MSSFGAFWEGEVSASDKTEEVKKATAGEEGGNKGSELSGTDKIEMCGFAAGGEGVVLLGRAGKSKILISIINLLEAVGFVCGGGEGQTVRGTEDRDEFNFSSVCGAAAEGFCLGVMSFSVKCAGGERRNAFPRGVGGKKKNLLVCCCSYQK